MPPTARSPRSLPALASSLGLAMASLFGIGLTELNRPVQAYDLHYRQNNSAIGGKELRRLFDRALPISYVHTFDDRQWSTWLLLDVHPDKGIVAITLGLCPRLSSSSAGDHRPMRDGQGAWADQWPSQRHAAQTGPEQERDPDAGDLRRNRKGGAAAHQDGPLLPTIEASSRPPPSPSALSLAPFQPWEPPPLSAGAGASESASKDPHNRRL